jgi:hypothetical protein
MRPTIRASSRYPSSHQLRFEKSSREKGRLLLNTVAGRLRMPSCCSAASTARAKRGYNCGLLKRCLDDGTSSPLMIRVFDVADQIADDFELIDFLVRDYDVREPIFDHDH